MGKLIALGFILLDTFLCSC